MYVFVDESGSTNVRSGQKYLVLAFCVCANKQFSEYLIYKIRDQCRKQGKLILNEKEVKYHDLSRYQQEIAIALLNREYRGYYVAYVDIEKADAKLTTGESEDLIQKLMMESVAQHFKEKLEQREGLTVIVDEKLSKASIAEIKDMVHALRKSKKDAKIETHNSRKIIGLQLADLVAGAFRAKLMKTSGLLDVKEDHILECKHDGDKLVTMPRKKK